MKKSIFSLVALFAIAGASEAQANSYRYHSTCDVQPGPYVGFRHEGWNESKIYLTTYKRYLSFATTLKNSQGRTKDDPDNIYYSLSLTSGGPTSTKIYAEILDLGDEWPSTVGYVDLKKSSNGTFKGEVFNEGVSFNVVCSKFKRELLQD